MMTALPVFLCLPLFLSLPAWHFFFLFPFFLFSLLIVFCAFPPLPPSSSPAYISWTVRWQRRLEESSQPLTQQEPPFCLSPCFMGSYDSCTLDRRRKRIIAREIKAGKDNTHIYAHIHFVFPSFPRPTPSLWLSLVSYFTLKMDPKVQSNNFFQKCFFNDIQWMIYYQTMSDMIKADAGLTEVGNKRWIRT